MRWLDRHRVEDAMKQFLSRFDRTNPKIALKIRHTYRTAALAERIAEEEGFTAAFCDTAWLAGMLHDAGRFVQLARYNTFMDADSIGHAHLSAQMLFDEGLISQFIEVDTCDPTLLAALHTAVDLHSDWKLPDGLDETTQQLCMVLRDADKIDILRVNCEEPVTAIYPFTEDELLASSLSPEVKQAFEDESTIQTSLKKLPADYALGHCAFGWELVFPASKKIAVEQGYLRQFFEREWRLPETRAYFESARVRMFDRLNATSRERTGATRLLHYR